MSYHIHAVEADGAGAAHISVPPGRVTALLVDAGVSVTDNTGRTLGSGSAYFSPENEPYVSGRVNFAGGSSHARHALCLHT